MHVTYTIAGKQGRLMNFIIDIICITVFAVILQLIVNQVKYNSLVLLGHVDRGAMSLSVILYYIIFEYFTGRTPGKYLTNTKVISLKAKRPTLFQVFVRTIMRMTFISFYSVLFGTELTFQDKLSNTRVVKINYE